MKIDLSGLFNNSVKEIPVNETFDFSDFVYSTYTPIKNGVSVKGSIYSKAEVVFLNLDINFNFIGYCDRCAESVEKSFSFNINKIVVEELQNEQDCDDYIVIKNRMLDLDELVNEEVALSLPSKILCKEDCKGLCAQCGTNLNVSKCDCKKDVDPRMEALLQLLEE